jgi:hypothetical protein
VTSTPEFLAVASPVYLAAHGTPASSSDDDVHSSEAILLEHQMNTSRGLMRETSTVACAGLDLKAA